MQSEQNLCPQLVCFGLLRSFLHNPHIKLESTDLLKHINSSGKYSATIVFNRLCLLIKSRVYFMN
jgi:hypothetical protein